MEYSIQKFSHLAGVSTRTLRYYDEIGLLPPKRINSSGYRIYGQEQVDRLQQILLYREFRIGLKEISTLFQDKTISRKQVLLEQLNTLEMEQLRMNKLIETLKKTILQEEGILIMTDKEKFDGLKKQMVEKNEEEYGKEIRKNYGNTTIDQSNQKMLNLSEEEYTHMQNLATEINKRLEAAVSNNIPPESEEGEQIAKLHKTWLGMTWPSYSTETHLGLVQMYLADERFKNYYDSKVEGCAKFLYDAVTLWLSGSNHT